ncbi:MAG: zeta toxin family protein [Oscillospiraceae bacterium]|nr:zeta toxin family protein [Oscillospiraceae bacterium]
MKTYNIIAGTNGVGKSSFTGVIRLRENLGVRIDVDKIAATSSISDIEAGKRAIKIIDDSIGNGVCFTQETTLSGKKTSRTVRDAKAKGYSIRLFYIGLDTAEESIKRIANRVSKGGHNIKSDDVLRRFGKRFVVLKEILPFCDEALFFDNDNGFIEVAEYKSGELLIKTEKMPKWLVELKEYLKNEK